MSTLLRPHRIFAILLAVVPFTLNAATIESKIDAFVSNDDGSWSNTMGIESFSGYGLNYTSDGRGGLNSSASAYAQTSADIGELKVWVNGFTGATYEAQTVVETQAYASINYQDSIKFASLSNRNGTMALAKINLFVPGNTMVRNSPYQGNEGRASFGLDVRLSGRAGVLAQSRYQDYKTIFNTQDDGAGVDTLPFSRLITISSWISLGDDLNLNLQMIASGSLLTRRGSGAFFSDYSNSLYFAGIDSLELADGTQITDFTATGEDGMDYRKSYVPTTPSSVPDTSSTLVSCLMALGGISLVKLRRRAA